MTDSGPVHANPLLLNMLTNKNMGRLHTRDGQERRRVTTILHHLSDCCAEQKILRGHVRLTSDLPSDLLHTPDEVRLSATKQAIDELLNHPAGVLGIICLMCPQQPKERIALLQRVADTLGIAGQHAQNHAAMAGQDLVRLLSPIHVIKEIALAQVSSSQQVK